MRKYVEWIPIFMGMAKERKEYCGLPDQVVQ